MTTYTSRYPTLDTQHVNVTSQKDDRHVDYFSFDPSKSLVGYSTDNCWRALDRECLDQRINVDLSSAYAIRRVYYENYHERGGGVHNGARRAVIYGSNDNIMSRVYNDHASLTELWDGELEIHADSNTVDPKYITIDNITTYRFYAVEISTDWSGGAGIGIRRMELQTEDGFLNSSSSSSSSSVDD